MFVAGYGDVPFIAEKKTKGLNMTIQLVGDVKCHTFRFQNCESSVMLNDYVTHNPMLND